MTDNYQSVINRAMRVRGVISLAAISLAFLISASGGARAVEIDFTTLVQKSLLHSHELMVAETEKRIADLKLKEAQALYFPTVSVRLGNEYLHDLDKESQQTAYVGDSVISGSDSTYQHSLSLNLNYNLYDFGAKGKRIGIAEDDIRISESNIKKSRNNLKLRLLGIYVRGLKNYANLQTRDEIIQLQQEKYHLSKRMHEAGRVGALEVTDAAVELADSYNNITDSRREVEAVLADLEFLSGEKFAADDTTFTPLIPVPNRTSPAVDVFPELAVYDLEIDKKAKELSATTREMWPSFNLYSSYRLYGRDENEFSESFNDMHRTNTSIGVTVSLKLFEGFSSLNKRERLQAEIRRLKLLRRQKKAELEARINTIAGELRVFDSAGPEWQSFLDQAESGDEITKKLADGKVIERLILLERQIDLLESRNSIELKKIEMAAKSLELQFYNDIGN